MRPGWRGPALWLGLSLSLISSATLAFSPADEDYRKLKGAEVRKTLIGKIFSDEAHFSERYKADGTIEGHAMGKKVDNCWKIVENALCITNSFDEYW
jgi:hypothetical protein